MTPRWSFELDMRRALKTNLVRAVLDRTSTLNLPKFLPGTLLRDGSDALFLLCAITMMLSILLGGGTRSGFLSDALLQLLTIPLLLFALSRLFDLKKVLNLPSIWALALCAAIILMPLVQLIPLPSWVWTHLPGRKPEAEVFELLGVKPPWMPISVSPDLTWQSALSLIPPIAVFVGTLLLGYRKRRLLSGVLLGFGLVSVVVGLLQVSQGETSPLRFFQFTNKNEAVGFFANRNHFAALLYSLTLFTAAWAIHATSAAGSWRDRRNYQAANLLPIVVSFTVLVVLISAQAIARSRAGLGITMIALFGALVLAYVDRREDARRTASKMIAVTVALAVIFSLQFALYRVMQRFGSDQFEDARIPIARNTLAAAGAFLPFGAGMGTFVPVYGIYEKPKDTLVDTYVNRAHDDVLEVSLEAGFPGVILMVIFVLGWGYQSTKLWRRRAAEGYDIDLALARAASMVVGLIILHSFVDYPLRTAAMMTIMAFACALLIDPPPSELRHEAQTNTQRRQNEGSRSGGVKTEAVARVSNRSAPAVPPLESFKERPVHGPPALDWPEEWLDSDSSLGVTSEKAPPKTNWPVND